MLGRPVGSVTVNVPLNDALLAQPALRGRPRRTRPARARAQRPGDRGRDHRAGRRSRSGGSLDRRFGGANTASTASGSSGLPTRRAARADAEVRHQRRRPRPTPSGRCWRSSSRSRRSPSPATRSLRCSYAAAVRARRCSAAAAMRERFALVGDALASTHNPDKLLPVILHATMDATGAVGGRIVQNGRVTAEEGDVAGAGRPLRLELGVAGNRRRDRAASSGRRAAASTRAHARAREVARARRRRSRSRTRGCTASCSGRRSPTS